jgi:VanZ family protein
VIVAVVAWGAIDEWHQSWVEGRTSDPLDLLTDGLAAIGFVMLHGALRGTDRSGRAFRGFVLISLLAMAGTAWNSLG